MESTDEDRLSVAWAEAARVLGIEVTVPFELKCGGRTHKCIAYLPDFSGGLLIAATWPPEFMTDRELMDDAASCGLCCSFINVEEYVKFDEVLYMDTLREWGFTGPPEKRPGWL